MPPIDNSYQLAQITDFSKGMITYLGALSLPLAGAANLNNVVHFPGRLKYRGGYQFEQTANPGLDWIYAYYNANGDKIWITWQNANVYWSFTGGTPTQISGASYGGGSRVGAVDIDGILYWSSGSDYGGAGTQLQYFDQVDNTSGNVAQTGPNVPPSSGWLFLYTGAIVALGVKYGSAAWQPCVMGWSSVTDPGYWDASNSQAVGAQNEGSLQFGLVFGMANSGVPPTRTFVVGRSGPAGIYSYTGALGSLAESVVNCPVGCLDGVSAVFVPGADNFGLIIFLGEDSQFWATNGLTAQVISLQILNVLQEMVPVAYAAKQGENPASYCFYAGYDDDEQYYFCAVNNGSNADNTVFVYKWDEQSWSTFTGWPYGPFLYGNAATDGAGLPAIFVGANATYVTIDGVQQSCVGVWQMNMAGIGDLVTEDNPNGFVPQISYTSPWIHAGNAELLKLWHWLTLFAYSSGVAYQVTVRALTRANDGTYMQTVPQVLIMKAASPIEPAEARTRLTCLYTPGPNDFLVGLDNFVEELKGTAVQVTVEFYSDPAYVDGSNAVDFDILGLQLRYLERGYRREGGDEYDSETGTPQVFSPMEPPLLPIDTDQTYTE